MIILASASPRRKELLSTLVNAFEVRPADIDETPFSMESPEEYVIRMAREKAEAIAKHDVEHRDVIIASDTSVVIDEQILGKPESFEHAKGNVTCAFWQNSPGYDFCVCV